MTSYRTLSSFWKNIGQKKNGEIRLLYTKRVQAIIKYPHKQQLINAAAAVIHMLYEHVQNDLSLMRFAMVFLKNDYSTRAIRLSGTVKTAADILVQLPKVISDK